MAAGGALRATYRSAPATTIFVLVTVFAWLFAVATQWAGALVTHAAFLSERLTGVADENYLVPAWLTPLTTLFVHAGFLHLGLNMLALALFGRVVEPAVGAAGLLLLYIVGAMVAVAAFFLVHPLGMPWIGSGGGVGAVMGAYAILFGRARGQAKGGRMGRWSYILWLCVGWTVLSLLVTVLFAAGWAIYYAFAIIASYAVGVLLGRLLLLFRYRKA
jgi:membrane associated rhomboid family serine protease